MELFEAFEALNALNEDTFAVSDDGIEKLSTFISQDEVDDTVDVIDTEAETEEELQDDYVGKVILDCCVCHSKIYKDKSEVEVNEEGDLANVGEDCPYCYTSDGFKVVGEVAPFEDAEEKETTDKVEENDDEIELETEEKVVEESLTEAVGTLEKPLSSFTGTLSNVMTAHQNELANISSKEEAISFLDTIEPEVKNKGYLATVKEKVAKLPDFKVLTFLYNIILKGDGMGSKLESLYESHRGDRHRVTAELFDILSENGFDTDAEDVEDYVFAARDLVFEDLLANPEMSIADVASKWFKDTKMNYPEDLEQLTKLSEDLLVRGADGQLTTTSQQGLWGNSKEWDYNNEELEEGIFGKKKKNKDSDTESGDSRKDRAYLLVVTDEHRNRELVQTARANDNWASVDFDRKEVLKELGPGHKVEIITVADAEEEFGMDLSKSVRHIKESVNISVEDVDDDELEEGIFGIKTKKEKEKEAKAKAEKERQKQRDKESKEREEKARQQAVADSWASHDKAERDARAEYNRSRSNDTKGGKPSNTPMNGQGYKTMGDFANAFSESKSVNEGVFDSKEKKQAREDDKESFEMQVGKITGGRDLAAIASDLSSLIKDILQEHKNSLKATRKKNAQFDRNVDKDFHDLKNLKSGILSGIKQTVHNLKKPRSLSNPIYYVRNLVMPVDEESIPKSLHKLEQIEKWITAIEDIQIQDKNLHVSIIKEFNKDVAQELTELYNELKGDDEWWYVESMSIKESTDDLPKNLKINIKDIEDTDEDTISDYLSDTYGFCHNGFEYDVTGDTVHVSNIEWDLEESKSIREDINNLSLDTDDTHMEMTSDESGKVTIVTEPIEQADSSDETIVPVKSETEEEIVSNNDENEVDVEIDEFDEETFDELGENFLRKKFENVESFKTKSVSSANNSLIIEGIIKFDSGNVKKTSFIFESKDCTRNGSCRFVGKNSELNEMFNFELTGKVNNRRFISESLKAKV